MSRYTTADEDAAFTEGANAMREQCVYVVQYELDRLKKSYPKFPLLASLSSPIEDYLDEIIKSLENETVKP